MILKSKNQRLFFLFLILFSVFFTSIFLYVSNKNPLISKLNSINNKFEVVITKPLLNTQNTNLTANLFQANLSNYWTKVQEKNENLLIKMKWVDVFDNIFLANIKDNKSIESYKKEIFENIENIEFVEENHKIYLQNYWFIEDEWSQQYVQFVKKFDSLKWKNQVNVAIFDTWVDVSNKFIRKALLKNNKEKRNKKDDDKNWFRDDFYWWNFIKWNNDVSDKNWHWTHVAGVYLLNPNVKILPIKVVKDSWQWDLSKLIKWFSYIKDFDIDIINISLWSFKKSDILESIIEELNKWDQKYFLAAAWNYSTNREFYPAAYDWVFGICSTDKNWSKSKTSDYWDWVSFCANWEDIFSFDLNSYFTMKSWTSQSTPIFWLFLSTILSNNEDPDSEFVNKTIYDFLKEPKDKTIIDKNYSTINSALKYLETEEMKNAPFFSDLDKNSLEWKAASFLNFSWIIKWYPDWTFRGEEKINRVELIKILLLAKYWSISSEHSERKNIFSDLSKKNWYWDYISKALYLWIINWYEDKTFKPLNWVTRAEFIKLFSKTFDIQISWNCPFEDVKESDWFYKYCWIIKEYDLFSDIWEKYMKPWEKLSRNDISTAIYNYLH